MAVPVSGWPECYREFFGRVSGLVGAGPGKWKCKCPAHDDKIQSLSVRVGNQGRLWVRCHAGGQCSVDAIMRALGLGIDDLFPDNKRHTKHEGKPRMSRTETVYQYTDEAGMLLFEAVRREPKSFCQRRPNPEFNPSEPPDREANPEYLYDLNGVRRVLYNLPFVLGSLARTPDKAVFVLEGEKDVETARAAGIVATTNPMGAGKWLPEFSEVLRGANVIVIPDNDAPGKAHAKAVCESLKDVARTVRYLELPGLEDKEDFSDWWRKSKGATEQKRGELVKLLRSCQFYGKGQAESPAVQPAQTVSAPVEQPAAPACPFPNSPTVAAGYTAPATEPKAAPTPVPVAVEPAPPAAEPAPAPSVPVDRAARVAQWFKDAKATAAALKAANARVETPVAFYGAVHLALAKLDQAFTMANGVPKLDMNAIGQVSLLLGAYLLQAAADFGLGCGVVSEGA